MSVSEISTIQDGDVGVADEACRRAAEHWLKADGAGGLVTADVRLIGLNEVRAAAGPRWKRLRERVREGSISILSRYLEPGESVIAAADGFVLVLKAGAGACDARRAAMREGLIRFYLGEEGLRRLSAEISAPAAPVSGVGANRGADHHELRRRLVRAPLFAVSQARVCATLIAPLTSSGSHRLGYDRSYIVNGAHGEGSFLDVDQLIAAEAAARLHSVRGGEITGFTVHASTMQRRNLRRSYLATLSSLGILRGQWFVTIAEIERGTPLIVIEEWCALLRRHVPHISLDFHISDHALTRIGATQAWAVGFHLPEHNAHSAAALQEMRFWITRAHAQQLRLAINGITSPGMLRAATALGADFVTSPKLWPFEGLEHSMREM